MKLWRTQGNLHERPLQSSQVHAVANDKEAEGVTRLGGDPSWIVVRVKGKWARNNQSAAWSEWTQLALPTRRFRQRRRCASPGSKGRRQEIQKENLEDKYLLAVAARIDFSNTQDLLRQDENAPPKHSCFASAKSRFSLSGGNLPPLYLFSYPPRPLKTNTLFLTTLLHPTDNTTTLITHHG